MLKNKISDCSNWKQLYEVIVQIGTKSISFPNKLCRNSLKEKEDII